MSIDITRETDADTWNRLLAETATPSPFHRYESLATCAEYAEVQLHPLVGYKGQEPVGVFPMYTTSKGPFTVAFSPAPNLKINYLGPALSLAGNPKRRRHDTQHERFLNTCLDWLAAEFDPGFTTIRTTVGYTDSRPFSWRGFDVSPRYTYSVRLDDADSVIDRFSSDARRNVRRDYDATVTVEDRGHGTIERVIEQIVRRHAAQGEAFPVNAAFVSDLYDRLPSGTVHPYELRLDGEFAVGVIDLEYAGRTLRWIGGAKTDVDVPVNDLLIFRSCLEAMDRDNEWYDLAGANHPRLWDYKAKFGPELKRYYTITRGTWTMRTAKRFYDRFR